METSKIEFKAKTSDGEWVFGCYVEYKVFGEELRQAIVDRSGYTHIVDPDTVCQFTCIVDAKGTKVFENDAAEMTVFNTEYYQHPNKEKHSGIVCRADNGEYYFSLSNGEKLKINDTIFVIGSKFD